MLDETSADTKMPQKHALFIDDNPGYLLKLINSVKSLGFDCRVISCARKAERLLKKEKYDVVVTDIEMPELNGFDLIRKLRAQHSATFVIAVSGRMDGKVESEAIKSGANAFFFKPLELDSFLTTLSAWFDDPDDDNIEFRSS
jgi:DNA-binding NtrC family response regulator